MDDNQAKALRAEFPKSAIGKLPKPTQRDAQRGNCKECGGYHGLPAVHLDYVGHAACTDRLLQVDPEWTWEPLALDEHGLPALDRAGNMWIRLTVAGVTRIGVGDGKSAKECIGDAIRNAAMRFGVALDLWAKEDLHAMDEARNDEPAPQPRKQAQPKRDTGEAISDRQVGAIKGAMRERGIEDRDQQLAGIAKVIGREVGSTKDLTKAEGSRVLDSLKGTKSGEVPGQYTPPPADDDAPPPEGWDR